MIESIQFFGVISLPNSTPPPKKKKEMRFLSVPKANCNSWVLLLFPSFTWPIFLSLRCVVFKRKVAKQFLNSALVGGEVLGVAIR